MQRSFCLAVCVTAVIALLVAASCNDSREKPTAQPAAKEKQVAGSSIPKTPMTVNRNDLCIVCHMDFDDEPITTNHLAGKMTCAYCHGKSVEHMEDETMMTSPDVLYGRKEVDAMCSHCHKPHKNPEAVEQFRKKWTGKRRENGRSIGPASVCTDCHGRHTVARR